MMTVLHLVFPSLVPRISLHVCLTVAVFPGQLRTCRLAISKVVQGQQSMPLQQSQADQVGCRVDLAAPTPTTSGVFSLRLCCASGTRPDVHISLEQQFARNSVILILD